MGIVSYAQNAEDVLLNRIFAGLNHGFYVDVGAYHPSDDSVTKTFYDRGWSGINLEPGDVFAELAAARPRDINLKLAVSDRSGEVSFAQYPGWYAGLSHVEDQDRDARAPSTEGQFEIIKQTVKCDTLTNVLETYAPGRPIAFLKIDAEGSETAIIRATDWHAIRPTVLLVEATLPRTTQLANQGWEPILLEHGYLRAYFDGINCFYVPQERADLLRAFEVPVNVLDGYSRPDPPALHRAQERIQELGAETVRLSAENMRYFERQQGLRDQLREAREQGREQVREAREQVREAREQVREAREQTIALQAQISSKLDLLQSYTRTMDELRQQRDGLSQRQLLLMHEANRLHRLIRELRWPDGPGSVRAVLPVARLLRWLSRTRTPEILPEEAAIAATTSSTFVPTAPAVPPTVLATAPPPPRRSPRRRVVLLAYGVVRPFVRPLAWRSRSFFTGRLHSQVEQINERLQGLVAERLQELPREPTPLPTAEISALRVEVQQLGTMLETTLLTLSLEQLGRPAGRVHEGYEPGT